MSLGNLLTGSLAAAGNALSGTGSTLGLGNTLQPVSNAIGEVGSTLGSVTDSALGAVQDLTSALSPTTPFQQCIVSALSSNTDLYGFPNNILGLGVSVPLTYDLADVHPYNLDYPFVPAAVTYPATAEQVSAVIQCGEQYEIGVQARTGGHGYANYALGGADGALVIDTKNLNSFVANGDGTVTFGAGLRLLDLIGHLASIGRTAAYGVVGDIGTGGHFTIGGLGPLSRLLGTATDQVISAECVLSNGTVLTASGWTNPDLFFAVRGAASSFASVTSFTISTIPANFVTNFQFNITAGRLSDLAPVWKKWQDFISQPDLSRLFSCTLTLTEGVLLFQGTYYGSEDEFNQLNIQGILPTGNVAISVTSSIVTGLVSDISSFALDVFGLLPTHFYAKTLEHSYETLLSEAAVQAMFEYIEQTNKGTAVWFIVWDLQGGATNDVPSDATAYVHRNALFFMQIYLVDLLATSQVDPTIKQFANGLHSYVQQLVPGMTDSAYPGYVDPLLPNPQRSYYGSNLPRLQQLKVLYDPNNVIRNPQSITAT